MAWGSVAASQEAWFSLRNNSQGACRSSYLSTRIPVGLVSPGDLNLQFRLTPLLSLLTRYAQLGAFLPVSSPSLWLQATAALSLAPVFMNSVSST